MLKWILFAGGLHAEVVELPPQVLMNALFESWTFKLKDDCMKWNEIKNVHTIQQ